VAEFAIDETMPRYVAFLRGVMPTNAKMPELKHCFEAAGFADVKTILGSGNVAFSAPSRSESGLERKAEAAMDRRLGRAFYTIIRPAAFLRDLLESDPYAGLRVPAHAKRVVTFLREPPDPKKRLPIERDGARILATTGREVFSAYVATPGVGPVFMTLIQKTFGLEQTTRTWETVKKCAVA
jgi:uncharacterized protein (DUF1697 family)